MPPLAKFAAAPFGVVERYAEGPDGPALLPVTLRNIEAQLDAKTLQPGAGQGGKVARCAPTATPTSLPGCASCSATTTITWIASRRCVT